MSAADRMDFAQMADSVVADGAGASGGAGATAGAGPGADAAAPAGATVVAADGEGADEAGFAASRMGLFLRSSLFDFVLVLAVSVGIDFMMLSGFDATLALRWNIPLQVGIGALMLLILFAGGWSKRAAGICAALAAVAFAAVLGVATALLPEGFAVFVDNQLNDAQGNYLIFAVVTTIVPTAVYLLSRRPAGVAALLLASVSVCASVQYLFRDWLSAEGGLVAAAVTLVGVLSLLVYQVYRQSAAAVERLRAPAFGKAAGFSVATALLCVGLGAAVFYALINPLALTTPTIKPFEQAVIRPIVQYTGIYDDLTVEDYERLTSRTNDEVDETKENAEGGDDVLDEERAADEELDATQDAESDDGEQGQQESDSTSPLISLVQSRSAYSTDDWSTDFDPVTYETLRLGIVFIVLAAVLAVVLAIALKRRSRTARLKRLCSRTPSERVVVLYRFFCKRFERLGIKRGETLTPLEFAYAARDRMEPFSHGTDGVDFVRVTLLYQRAAYGCADVSEDDYAQVERYYTAFFANARRFVGGRRWLVLFWLV